MQHHSMTTLFNSSSDVAVSTRFRIDNQITVVGYGIPSGGVVTFEAVLYSDSGQPPGQANTCTPTLSSGPAPTVLGSSPIICCAGAQVQLTAANPIIVLESPQRTWIRAIYTGPDLGSFIVSVTQSSVSNVTDAMRGCCQQPPVVVPTPHLVNGATATLALGGGLTVTPAGEDNYIFTPIVTNTVVLTNCTGGIIHTFETL